MKVKQKEKRLNIAIGEDLKNQLEEFSEESGVSQAGTVRMALNKFLSGENK